MKRITFLALAGVAASAAVAQTKASRDPLDSGVPVPGIQYRSAFEGYQPYRDPPVVEWRDANDAVRAFGGHAGHLVKPGSAGTSQPVTDAAGAPETQTSGHGGHR